MSDTPIDRFMFQNVDWKETGETPNPEGIPFATHEGVLRIFEMDIRCARLSTGQAVIFEEDAIKLLNQIFGQEDGQ